MDDPAVTETLEAFADTLIPGQKRFPGDRAIAGVVSRPGAVQAGAIEMMNFRPVGFTPIALFFLALQLHLSALVYAVIHNIRLEPGVPHFVALDFESRTALLVKILGADGTNAPDPAFYGLASVVFFA